LVPDSYLDELETYGTYSIRMRPGTTTQFAVQGGPINGRLSAYERGAG
jgi:hypothetical protein